MCEYRQVRPSLQLNRKPNSLQSYRGLPKSSPDTSPYFDLPPHDKNKDQYSIAFKFSPKSNINGDDLVFGNDFDHPIKDRLPPGFNYAFKIVKWVVDPGLDGDVYADKPYLYGPAASSVNTLHVSGKGEIKSEAGHEAGLVFKEGGDAEGMELRKEKGVPEIEAARKKHFLNEDHRKQWEWEAGKVYGCDFFNPYLDFNGTKPMRNLSRMLRRGYRFRPPAARLHPPDHEVLGRPRSKVSSHSLPLLGRADVRIPPPVAI